MLSSEVIEMPLRRTKKDLTVSSNTRTHKLLEINFGRERVVLLIPISGSPLEFSLFKNIHLKFMS